MGGATPRPRSGGGGQEEIPSVQGQGQRPGGIPDALKPKARGSGREDQPHVMAAQAQEGLEELSHVEGQEGRR